GTPKHRLMLIASWPRGKDSTKSLMPGDPGCDLPHRSRRSASWTRATRSALRCRAFTDGLDDGDGGADLDQRAAVAISSRDEDRWTSDAVARRPDPFARYRLLEGRSHRLPDTRGAHRPRPCRHPVSRTRLNTETETARTGC